MREVLFPRLVKLRANDELNHGLAEAARRDRLTLSEFAPGELRSVLAARDPSVSPRTAVATVPGPFRRPPAFVVRATRDQAAKR